MTSQTGKVKGGTIKLPSELEAAWENADVYIMSDGDRISIQRLSTPSLGAMLDEFSEMGKRIGKKDLNAAIRSAREE